MEAIRFPGLVGVRGLSHGVTTRAGGASDGPFASLNLGRRTGDDPSRVAANRRAVGVAFGGRDSPVFPRQVHGAHVALLADPIVDDVGEADGVATALVGTSVGVLGADCPGVLLVDPARRALAVVHAGWRGAIGGAVEAAVSTLGSQFSSKPSDLLAGIGPGISARRYEVGPEVADAFRSAFPDSTHVVTAGRGDRSFVDLRAAIRLRLLSCGLATSSIESIDACTYDEHDLFFSHRRDGERTGRHALVALWSE